MGHRRARAGAMIGLLLFIVSGLAGLGSAESESGSAESESGSAESGEHVDYREPHEDAVDEDLLEELRTVAAEEAKGKLSEMSARERVRYALMLSQHAIVERNVERANEWTRWAGDQVNLDDHPGLSGDVSIARARISELTGNVRAAVSWSRRAADAYGSAGLLEAELNALARLASTQHRLGLLGDGIETADRVISQLEALPNDSIRGRVLLDAAMMRYKIGRLEEVPDLLDEAYEYFVAEDDHDGMGTVYRFRGNYHGSRGNTEEALRYYERAAEKYERTGNTHDAANVSFNIGLSEMNEGRYEEAAEYLEEAVDGFVEAGSISGAGMAATELSVALWVAGRPEEADSALASAIGMLEATQSLRRLARAYTVRASIQSVIGDEGGARDSLREARNLYDELGLRDEADAIQRELDELGDDRDGGI